ncbi:uncharacterized protein LOC131674950 [Phymastichus coffea]|uniref:uncharacterized protein LOC131674950 n=1 Tax=Phymastichus coffea TaxID=108790 RepID=UPI00273A9520|nr:uncharacterized protein LOC131674950 [Phymastichus coffea]
MERLLVLIVAASVVGAIQAQNWRPIIPSAALTTNVVHRVPGSLYKYNLHEDDPEHQNLLGLHVNRDECSIYKVVMNQQLYFEYIHYKIDLPDLKEFTLCMWTKFNNHSNDHPLFSYATSERARSILAWVANTQRSSYFMLNVDGHNLYRLNYPLRLNRWYHSCQSWNGRTGEWQIWVNDERVGRGFNNRLVGHVIKGGGVAISGQEQRQLAGGFLEGEGAPPGSGGMLGEITMLQLYGVALSAGKAHRDHKHHHAHHFEHDTSNNVPPSTTTTQAPVTGPPLPMHPLLTAGQINYKVKVNPGAQLQISQNGLTLRHPGLPQPLPPAIIPEQSTIAPAISPFNFAQQLLSIASPRPAPDSTGPFGGAGLAPPVNGFSFVDRRYRDAEDDGTDLMQRIVENMELKRLAKRGTAGHSEVAAAAAAAGKARSSSEPGPAPRKTAKRGLVFPDGSIVDDAYVQQSSQLLSPSDAGFLATGLAGFGPAAGAPLRQKHAGRVDEEETNAQKEYEREPAEDEVRRVMNVCDGCAEEPFEKALVLGWRAVPKKLYSGALHVPALQACKAF